MPFDRSRLKALREIKGLNQDQLPGLSQNQVYRCEKYGTDSIKLLEKLVDALDCPEGFLLGRTYPDLDLANQKEMRRVASRMAYDVFADQRETVAHQRQRCYSVIGHGAAPLSADAWMALAEQIDLAVPPESDGQRLRVVNGND